METITKEGLQSARSPELRQAGSAPGLSYVLAAAVLATFYLVTSLYVASHRLLWFDEVFTVHMARLPDWKTILEALGHGVDSLPPAYYLVVRISDKLFTHTEVAVRLPSTLAMVATLLITFDCARRLTDGLHGLIALAVASSPLAGEGFEARSYAIYVMFAALALWTWTYTGVGRKWSPVLFGAVLFLGVSFHYYAVLLLVPFALWEISRWKPWQPPSPKLIAGASGVLLSAALLSHYILSFSQKFSTGFWSRPSLSELLDIYSHIFVGGLFVLALSMVWIVLADRQRKSIVLQPMPSGEAIGWLFLCIPLAGFVAAELKTNAFAVRYFLGLVPGVAVAFSCCLWRLFRNASLVSLGVLLIVATWGMARQFQVARHPESVESPGTRGQLSLEGLLSSEGKRYFVFSDPFLFLEVQYYSKHPEECILLLPSDFKQDPASARSSPDPYLHQRVELLLSRYYPLQFWRPDQLREHAQESALIRPTPDALEAVRAAGLAVDDRLSKPVRVVYLQ